MLCRQTEQPLPPLAITVHVCYLLSPSSPRSSRSHCVLFSSPCQSKTSSLRPSSGSPCPSIWRYYNHSFPISLGRQAGSMIAPELGASLHHTLKLFVFIEQNRRTSNAVPHAPITIAKTETSFCHCVL